MQEFIQLLLKNKLTNFSEAVRGLFLPPAKLRPQNNVTMFTNRKMVYYNISIILKTGLKH